MSRNGLALLVGLIFGLGLCLSGMSDPNKVLGFLDLAGAWDPSLAFVMAGAVACAAPGFALAKRKRFDFSGAPVQPPAQGEIDPPLLIGSAIFGVGWGLSGICPGPGIVDLGFLSSGAAVFVAASLVGAAAFRVFDSRLRGAVPVTQDG